MSLSMRIVAGVAALAALVLSVTAASACCGGCGCGCGYGYGSSCGYGYGYGYGGYSVYAPVQATYAVDQGPVYDVPAAVAPEPVPEYVGPVRRYGYGYRGWRAGYRGVGGWGRHRVGGWARGWGRGWGRYPLRARY
jgi:hypothetical protein